MNEPFLETYWNAAQVFAWVCLGDRESVRLYGDERERPCSVAYVAMAWAMRPDEEPLPELPYRTWREVHDAILRELCTGRLIALGRENNASKLQEIPALEWADMDIFYDPDHAGPKEISRLGASEWHGLKFERNEVLAVWPDELSILSNVEPQDETRRLTVVGEKGCELWLISLMGTSNPTKSKSHYLAEAKQTFRISGKGFARAWSAAIKATGSTQWSRPGPSGQGRS